jgi:predicted transcriptional regulator
MNTLKASCESEASDAIVVSFDAKWRELLAEEDITKVFRKRAPRNSAPRYIYIYIGAPISAICGRFEVLKLEWLPIEEVLAIASKGAISTNELQQYSRDYKSLAVYTVSKLKLFQIPLTYTLLHQRFQFSPPQSFFTLSKTGQHQIDDLAGLPQRSTKGIQK